MQQLNYSTLGQRCSKSPFLVHDFNVVLKDNDFQYKVRVCMCARTCVFVRLWGPLPSVGPLCVI